MTAPLYVSWRVPKSNGSYRIVSEPSPDLKAEQHRILEALSLYGFHDAVHGFVKGRSPLTNAAPHLNKRYVLNVDIADFFPSILSSRLLPILSSLLPPPLLERIEASCLYRDALPQGAPTSPALANFFLTDLDHCVHQFAVSNSLEYTRYADDMTLSSSCDFLKVYRKKVMTFLRSALSNYGLSLNPRKTKLMPYYQRQVVTGILVNNREPALPRRFKEALYLRLKGRTFSDLSDSELGQLYFVRSISSRSYSKILKGVLDVPDEKLL